MTFPAQGPSAGWGQGTRAAAGVAGGSRPGAGCGDSWGGRHRGRPSVLPPGSRPGAVQVLVGGQGATSPSRLHPSNLRHSPGSRWRRSGVLRASPARSYFRPYLGSRRPTRRETSRLPAARSRADPSPRPRRRPRGPRPVPPAPCGAADRHHGLLSDLAQLGMDLFQVPSPGSFSVPSAGVGSSPAPAGQVRERPGSGERSSRGIGSGRGGSGSYLGTESREVPSIADGRAQKQGGERGRRTGTPRREDPAPGARGPAHAGSEARGLGQRWAVGDALLPGQEAPRAAASGRSLPVAPSNLARRPGRGSSSAARLQPSSTAAPASVATGSF